MVSHDYRYQKGPKSCFKWILEDEEYCARSRGVRVVLIRNDASSMFPGDGTVETAPMNGADLVLTPCPSVVGRSCWSGSWNRRREAAEGVLTAYYPMRGAKKRAAVLFLRQPDVA